MEQVLKPIEHYLKGEFGHFRDKDGESYIILKNIYDCYEVFNNIALGKSVNETAVAREHNNCGTAIALSVKINGDYKTLEFKYSKVFTKFQFIFSDLYHLNLTPVGFNNSGILSNFLDPFPNIEYASVITTIEALKEYHKRKGDTHGLITLKHPHKSDNDRNERSKIERQANLDEERKRMFKKDEETQYEWANLALGIHESQSPKELEDIFKEPNKPIKTTSKESDFQNPVIISSKQTKNKLL